MYKLQGCLRHSKSQHLLFIVPEVRSMRNCSSCSAFQPKAHLSLRAQKNFMPELTKWSPCIDKYTRWQRKHWVSGHQDQESTHRGWHFDSAEANIKTDVKRTRTSAKYRTFLSKNILQQRKRYFLKSISVAKPHFAQLLQAWHTPRLKRCRMQVLHKY